MVGIAAVLHRLRGARVCKHECEKTLKPIQSTTALAAHQLVVAKVPFKQRGGIVHQHGLSLCLKNRRQAAGITVEMILCEYSRRNATMQVGNMLFGGRGQGVCLRHAGCMALHNVVCAVYLQQRCGVVTPEGVLRPAKCKARATRAGT